MTHDELLAKIDTDQELTAYINAGLINGDITINTGRQHWFQSNALRAVVELHKPNLIPDWVPTEEEFICWCAHIYPCPTIQAIEKELG